jgi:large conductance mechanosensitive channel
VIKEFKEFIARGSAFDLAIGVIIGAAFGAVVNSLVDDVIMQAISAIFGQPNFNSINIHWGHELIGGAQDSVKGKYPGLKHAYDHQIFVGALLTKIVTFFIVAFAAFIVIKAVNRFRRPLVAPTGPTEIELLTDIRDALRAPR